MSNSTADGADFRLSEGDAAPLGNRSVSTVMSDFLRRQGSVKHTVAYGNPCISKISSATPFQFCSQHFKIILISGENQFRLA